MRFELRLTAVYGADDFKLTLQPAPLEVGCGSHPDCKGDTSRSAVSLTEPSLDRGKRRRRRAEREAAEREIAEEAGPRNDAELGAASTEPICYHQDKVSEKQLGEQFAQLGIYLEPDTLAAVRSVFLSDVGAGVDAADLVEILAAQHCTMSSVREGLAAEGLAKCHDIVEPVLASTDSATEDERKDTLPSANEPDAVGCASRRSDLTHEISIGQTGNAPALTMLPEFSGGSNNNKSNKARRQRQAVESDGAGREHAKEDTIVDDAQRVKTRGEKTKESEDARHQREKAHLDKCICAHRPRCQPSCKYFEMLMVPFGCGLPPDLFFARCPVPGVRCNLQPQV